MRFWPLSTCLPSAFQALNPATAVACGRCAAISSTLFSEYSGSRAAVASQRCQSWPSRSAATCSASVACSASSLAARACSRSASSSGVLGGL
jgi:hypothetical protein